MHKGLIISGMITALFWAPVSYAQNASPLSAWVGKMPSDSPFFWREADVKSIMIKFIPSDLIHMITSGWGGGSVEAPIERNGDMLGLFVCKAHDCASHAARLYFNLKQKTVQLCWTERYQGALLDVWFSGADVKHLPQNACATGDLWDNLTRYGIK